MGQSRVARAIPRPRDPNVRCHGIVYGFDTLRPDVGRVVVGYVGQTVQRIGQRERQHRDCQPWSDLIVGEAYVIEEGMWTQVELDERETFHIHRLRPLYNYDENLGNPDRIPIPVARRQREERDRARGVASPVWDRAARPAREPVAAQRRELAWGWLWTKPAGYAALWMVIAVGLWLVTGDGGWKGSAVGAAAASASFVIPWVGDAWTKLTRRRRRKRRR